MVYELEKEHKKSSLMCKKKEELVKEIKRLEHNVNVLNERLNVQADAIKRFEQESRNKAITEFYDKALNFEDYIEPVCIYNGTTQLYSGRDISKMIKKIAEEMRCAE